MPKPGWQAATAPLQTRAGGVTTLIQEHGVARQTAAKALQLLEREGLTRRVPGLGYYVKKPPKL